MTELKAELNAEDMAAFQLEQKEAFRASFDLLKGHLFPPINDDRYFLDAAKLMAESVSEHPENRLLPYLNGAVMDYLGEITKDLQKSSERKESI